MKMYLVQTYRRHAEWPDYVGVFSTTEKAEAWCESNRSPDEGCDVLTFEVDNPEAVIETLNCSSPGPYKRPRFSFEYEFPPAPDAPKPRSDGTGPQF